MSDTLWQSAAEPSYLAVHRYENGKVLALEEEFDQKMRIKYGAPFLDLHRVDLQRALHARAASLGVHFQFGERVEEVDFDKLAVITKSGNTYTGDLVVGADGLWSRCRQCFLQSHDDPIPTGDLAYRMVLSLDQLKDADLKEWVAKPSVHFWIGPRAHAVGYSLRNGEMYNIVLLVPDDLPPKVARQSGSIEEMKALFADWDPM